MLSWQALMLLTRVYVFHTFKRQKWKDCQATQLLAQELGAPSVVVVVSLSVVDPGYLLEGFALFWQYWNTNF